MSDENNAALATTTVTGTTGTVVREGFGTTSMTRTAETASTAVAAAARAAIEARCIMAIQRPRDLDTVRTAILKECKRPGFAAVARYRKPIGEGIEGPSVRFAEAAVRCMGNITPEFATIYDDAEKRIVRVSVSDLECNVTYSGDVTIEKTTEVSKLRDGQVPLRVRTNSVGKPTYLVEATEDQLLNKQGALVSKQFRTLALRVIPGDLVEEAMAKVIETLQNEDAKDPDATKKKIVDAFVGIGVQPSDLRAYLGHDLGASSPAELTELRAVFASIKDGEATWKDTLEHKQKTPAAVAVDGDKPVSLKDKVKAKAAATQAVTVDADGVVTTVSDQKASA